MSYTKTASIGRITLAKEILFSELHPNEQALLAWSHWVRQQLMDSETGVKLEIEPQEWLKKLMTILTDQELAAEEEDLDDALAESGMEED